MGFDHAKTTHHFLLTASGGIIDVSANDPADTASRDAIRSHLAHIAKKFADGDFEAPMLIHGRVPPGVPEMKRDGRRSAGPTRRRRPADALVASTKDAATLSAIHDFLRFQIEDHRTGDPTDAPEALRRAAARGGPRPAGRPSLMHPHHDSRRPKASQLRPGRHEPQSSQPIERRARASAAGSRVASTTSWSSSPKGSSTRRDRGRALHLARDRAQPRGANPREAPRAQPARRRRVRDAQRAARPARSRSP